MKESNWFMIVGVIFIIVGILWKFGFGSLPGDIRIEKEKFRLYIPLTSSIITSIIISLTLLLYKAFKT